MRRLVLALLSAGTMLLLLAPVALARNDGGEGLYGETNDKVVTNASFLVIAFFPLLILLLTVVQGRLEKRKDARKAAAKARAESPDWGGDW